jgi:hypothetical protein
MKKRFLVLPIFLGIQSLTLWGQSKVTRLHNPEQQLPVTIGVQSQMGSTRGFSLGTDYIFSQKDKFKSPKKENRRERHNQTTQHVGFNFQLAHAENSYNTYILQAEQFVRKTKTSGYTWQLGYGIGWQRNQYIGHREANTIAGRSYLIGSLKGGVGYDLSKIGAKGSVLLSVRKDFLTSGLKRRGSNTVLELTYRLPLFNF